nr:glycoside hydrolase family 65 protein [Actinomycetota bacterium]
REVPTIEPDPTWTLVFDGVDPLLERVRESLLTLADGRLGTRGSVLVTSLADMPSVLHAGVYVGSGPETELLAGPRWNRVTVELAETPTVRRVLDLHTGVLRQELQSGEARLEALLLSSLALPATTAVRIRDRGFGIPMQRGLQPPGAAAPEQGTGDGAEWMRVLGSPGSIAAAVRETVSGPAGDRVLDRITAYEGDATGVADERRALRTLTRAQTLGFETLLGEHRHAWAARWENADVRVDGDPELQLAVRLALFHLMASVSSEGDAAVGARGLTGSAYRGHVFWDSDVYVLPFLAATHPAAARAMLEYRIRRLPAAVHAARALGRSGARFAWESATSGEDVTPRSAPGRDGEVQPILTGELEEHIVADVAWAAQHYTDWTGDVAFARGPGRELLVQTARWWASRIELDEDERAHIRGVIGPDEYHERVDDNAYTNVMARWNLRQAAHATADGAVESSERHRWLELADSLIDGYDPQTGLYEQFAGFYTLEPLIVAEIAPHRPVAADQLLGAARTHAAQVVKQADVLMLHYLIPEEVADGSLGPNLLFYEPRTAHGSSLSVGVHATLLARAGRLDPALELLRLTARIDLDDIGQVTAGGVHLAAMGSLWRALSLGFAGLAPDENGLRVDPVAMPGIDALELRLRFRGSRVRVRVTAGTAQISASPPITILVPGHDSHKVGPDPFRFDLSPRSERSSPP